MRAPSQKFGAQLQVKARDLGFDLCRITAPSALAPETAVHLADWLKAGHAGDMDWIEASVERRSDPLKIWPQTQSIIMLGLNYAEEGDALAGLQHSDAGNISIYARHRDYHDLLKGRMKTLAQWLISQNPNAEVKVFVDTAPVMEKPLAAAAGLGWQGKHTNLVSRELGSWFFLGAIFTTLSLPPDAPESDHCGSCQACLDICPTSAFPAPYRLDARLCISYLTIEHKGHIDAALRAKMGNRIYGCDDCLAVCPWNKFAKLGREAKLQARADLIAPSLRDLLVLDDTTFRQKFAGSPIKRIGIARFLRNVLIAAGNSGETQFCELIEPHLRHTSPLVRKMAVWALYQLAPPPYFRASAAKYLPMEGDASVIAEWQTKRRGDANTEDGA